MKTLAPAVPPVLVPWTQWAAQWSVRLPLRPDLHSLFRQPLPFPIALDMLLCAVPNRHSHCSQALHQTLPRPWSSSGHVDVQMGVGPVESQSSLSSFPPCRSKEVLALFFNSLITNLSSGGTRCNDLAFWTPISCENDTHVRLSLAPCQPSFHGPISDPDCLLARRELVHHSFSEWQHLARARFPKNTHKYSSPVVFHLKILIRLHAACRISHAIRMLSLGSFSCRRFSSNNHIARQTDTSDHSVRVFNLALTLMAGSGTMSHQRSLDSCALYSFQQLHQHGFLV